MIGNESEILNSVTNIPLSSITGPLIGKISVLVGGIFGLYVILTLSRIYFDHKRTRVLEDIRYNLEHLNSHFGVPSSQQRMGLFRRFVQRVRNYRYQQQIGRISKQSNLKTTKYNKK